MTFSYAWMKLKNPKLAKTKLLDIKVQKQRTPIMMTKSELQTKSQALSFQDHEVKQPFKSAKLEVTPARNTVRTLFCKAKTREKYPWNEKPIMVTHLHAHHAYVIPMKTQKQKLCKSKQLTFYCPALRPKATGPSPAKKAAARVPNLKISPRNA